MKRNEDEDELGVQSLEELLQECSAEPLPDVRMDMAATGAADSRQQEDAAAARPLDFSALLQGGASVAVGTEDLGEKAFCCAGVPPAAALLPMASRARLTILRAPNAAQTCRQRN